MPAVDGGSTLIPIKPARKMESAIDVVTTTKSNYWTRWANELKIFKYVHSNSRFSSFKLVSHLIPRISPVIFPLESYEL
jgi:hypothetical protein